MPTTCSFSAVNTFRAREDLEELEKPLFEMDVDLDEVDSVQVCVVFCLTRIHYGHSISNWHKI